MQHSYIQKVSEFLDSNGIQTYSSSDCVYDACFNKPIFQEHSYSQTCIGAFYMPYCVRPIVVSCYNTDKIQLTMHSIVSGVTQESLTDALHQFVSKYSSLTHSSTYDCLARTVLATNKLIDSIPQHLQSQARTQRLHELQELANQLKEISDM